MWIDWHMNFNYDIASAVAAFRTFSKGQDFSAIAWLRWLRSTAPIAPYPSEWKDASTLSLYEPVISLIHLTTFSLALCFTTPKFDVKPWIANAELTRVAIEFPLTNSLRCHQIYQDATTNDSFSPRWFRIGACFDRPRPICWYGFPDEIQKI
jgi:hypothetical protein